MKIGNILIVDDEKIQRETLGRFLEKRNFNISLANGVVQAINIVKNSNIDLVISDYKMKDGAGIDVLKGIKEINPFIEVIIITAYGNMETAIDVLKKGAYDYLIKPINLEELLILIGKVFEKRDLIKENKELRRTLEQNHKFESFITNNPKMENAINIAARASLTNSTILIRGESGTGKEVIAKAIYLNSSRSKNKFIVVNCSALNENLLESELFGHEKGSFTGAVESRVGRFEEADKGTLFLDEIGDISTKLQVKLLRVIQFGEFSRVGSNKIRKVDVRILCATNRNLEEMIKTKEFREDFYYRINVIPINLPPLRERKSDIVLFVAKFLEIFAEKNNREIIKISDEALDLLIKYNFPGNIRELDNIIERAAVLCRNNLITSKDLPLSIKSSTNSDILDPTNFKLSFPEKVKEFEKQIVENALEKTGFNKSAAARILQITERHIRSIINRLGISK